MDGGAMKVENWSVIRNGMLSEQAIRARYRGKNVSIRTRRYEPGSSYGGTMRPARVYVLEGRCLCGFHATHEQVELRAGQVAVVPGGDYVLEVLGQSPMEVVWVSEVAEARHSLKSLWSGAA